MEKGCMPWFEDTANRKCITLGVPSNVFFKGGRLVSNFCEVLGIGTHEGLNHMLKMSGIAPYFITGGGSDYDKLQALAEVLPLWLGHPYVTAIQGLLLDLLHCPLPLTKETLPHIWTYTAEKFMTENLSMGDLLVRYGYNHVICQDTVPVSVLSTGLNTTLVWDATPMLNPHDQKFAPTPCDTSLSPQQVWGGFETSLRCVLGTKTAQGLKEIWVDMSGCHTYQRPHPYTAGQAYIKAVQGEDVSLQEKNMILAQSMRVLGQYAKEKQLTLVLHHVSPQVYHHMTAYLATCGGDAPMTCVAYDPTNAIALARLGAKIMLAMDLRVTRQQVFDALGQVAVGMPVGSLAGLYLPVVGLLDIPLVKRMEALVNEWIIHMRETQS